MFLHQLQWQRSNQPVLSAMTTAQTWCRVQLYDPAVLCVDGGVFEIFCSISQDGTSWTHLRAQPAFPATRHPDHFDGRYTSTPCVLDEGDRYLLYYSTRDRGNLYGAGDGTVKADGCGIYRHIGVAIGTVNRP